MIHGSPFPAPRIPDTRLPAFVLEHAAQRGSQPALVDGVTGEEVSYRDLRAAVVRIAAWLTARGIGAGDTVAIAGVNHPRWAAVFYGVTAAGAAAAPINPALTSREVAELLTLARTRLLLTDGTTTSGMAGAQSAGVAVAGWGEVLAAPPGEEFDRTAAGATPVSGADHPDTNQPAVIAFSSGTTGRPKGVVLTHRNLVSAIVQHQGIYHVGPSDRFLAALPLFHIYGLSMILDYGLRHGATIITLPRFDLARYLDLIERYRVTWLHVAPPVLLQLVSDAAADADLTSVRHVVSGAAPLDAGLAARAQQRMRTPVGQGYGMTEASPGVTWVPDDGSIACPPGSVGVLIGGTEARLIDPASGEDVDGPGELWVRGPQVMTGYLADAATTDRTIVDGGWLRTGDIARVDERGVWWIVDRLKELIKYKGYQVAPAELEALMLEHPDVVDVAVAGVPDPSAGEIPKAWVVAARPVDEAELLAWVAERVAPYKRIRLLEYVDAIPKSPSGKILRRQLRSSGVPPAV